MQKKVENFGTILGPKMQSINESAAWINEIKESVSERRKEGDIMIDAVELRQQIGKLPKW